MIGAGWRGCKAGPGFSLNSIQWFAVPLTEIISDKPEQLEQFTAGLVQDKSFVGNKPAVVDQHRRRTGYFRAKRNPAFMACGQ